MITNSKQDWTVGAWVKVGFLTLQVMGMSNGIYLLCSKKGKMYEFQPHYGIQAV